MRNTQIYGYCVRVTDFDENWDYFENRDGWWTFKDCAFEVEDLSNVIYRMFEITSNSSPINLRMKL